MFLFRSILAKELGCELSLAKRGRVVSSRAGWGSMLVRVFALLAVLLVPASACAEDPARTLRELLVQYRCPVIDRLEQIYKAAPSSHPQNLFLIVSFAARPHDYV